MAGTQRRKYELKARAESQARTRERIVQATMELHKEVGPAKTTVAEIARRAGVQRLTVYNHFPEDVELFGGLPGPLDRPPPTARPRPCPGDYPTRRNGPEVLHGFYGWYEDGADGRKDPARQRRGASARRV